MKTSLVKIPFKCPYCNESCRYVDTSTSTLDMDCKECDNSKEQGRDIRKKYNCVSVISIIATCILFLIVSALLMS